ncbi:MAG: TrmB family transcriptional regulator [Halodesulfurarchaeum sp.]
MSVDPDQDPIQSLEALGLPNYEARVFVALQKLGTGTAKEVSDVGEIPRSQVYGAADSLEERGLIEIQDSTPKTFRPVSLPEARKRLQERFRRNQERAFEYLDRVQNKHDATAEEQEGVWRLSGQAAVEGRTRSLVEDATERIVLGFNEGVEFTEKLRQQVLEKREEGVDVQVIEEDAGIREELEAAGFEAVEPRISETAQAGRLLVVDRDTILMSVLDEQGTETAIWSAHSGFARVLVPLVEDAVIGLGESA